jgi:hypothetical protein
MKVSAVLFAAIAACVALVPPAAVAALRPVPVEPVQPAPLQPTEVAVPASVVAAHPDGWSLGLAAVAAPRRAGIGVTPNVEERIGCWRAYFTNDHGGWFGEETEWINPYWCGNGHVTRGLDTSWHGQSCSVLVSCAGESGPGTWYGCPYGCGSIGQQIDGHFRVHLVADFSVDLSIAYELYGNGGSWNWVWHN